MPNDYLSTVAGAPASLDESYPLRETGYRTLELVPHPTDIPAASFRYRVIKRSFDVTLVLVTAPLWLVFMLVVACLVRLSSPGPVFYSHRRINRKGGFFSMWKFRTMCSNSGEVLDEYLARNPAARAEWRATHKLRCDPRVTRLGAFLRRYSIDELPQLWNVLVGQMTLVGPRPIVAAEVEKYGKGFACYCRVKSGLTGLWQVSGRSRTSYPERVALDCEYVRRWSLLLDIKILFRTFRAVSNQDGAY